METNPTNDKKEEALETEKSNTPPVASDAEHSQPASYDLEKILLPQKMADTRAAENAPPVSVAKVLADQIIPVTPHIPKTPQRLPNAPEDISDVKSLETYQGDIEGVVQDKSISIVNIAAAEAGRRARDPGSSEKPPKAGRKTFGLILGGIVLLCAGGGLITYLVLTSRSVPISSPSVASIISVDETENVSLNPNATPQQVMATLQTAENQISLSLGLIGQLMVTEPATSTNAQPQAVSAQTFLSLLAPDIPQSLLLTVQPQFLFGVYSYQKNEPFLILKVNSYEQAFSGMLAWENTMEQDLSPVFVPAGASVYQQAASSTSTTAPQVLNTPFTDSIIENHDARVLEDAQGNIVLFWTFLDPNTLVIATNDATLQEIISRLSEEPILPTP